MASQTLLLLSSVLLGFPGLASCSVSALCHDLATANLCGGEQLSQGLAQEVLQDNLLTTREGKGIHCHICQKIIWELKEMVGEEPDEASIAEAASRVCGKLRFLRGLCKKTMKMFLKCISQDIIDGKTPKEVCVDIRMCKPKAGLL